MNNEENCKFIAKMAHDLKSPLNSIFLLSEILMTCDNSDLSDEKRKEYLEVINRSAKKLMALINDSSEFYLFENDHFTPNKEQINLNELLKEVHAEYDNLASLPSLIFEIKNELGIDFVFETDKYLLNRSLRILLSNAFNFTEKGKVVLRVYEGEKKIYFSVLDTGCGFQAASINKIFDLYGQDNNQEYAKSEGKGLGLCLLRLILSKLGGNVTVESQEGNGSEFKLELPV